MSKTREYRKGLIRAVPGAPEGTVEVTAVAYGVVDDYGSLWAPDVFQRSLAERWPTFAWAHNWSEPIGRALEQAQDGGVQRIKLRLDLQRDAETRQPLVPRAWQAWTQMQPTEDGHPPTLDDVSVGFSNVTRRPPTDEERSAYPGVKEVITDADLDEVSVVLRGAVPGAKVLATRAAGGTVDLDAVVGLAKKVTAGDLSQAEADEALRLLAVDDDGGTGAGGGGDEGGDDTPPPEDPDPEAVAEAEAAADAALADATDRSSRR